MLDDHRRFIISCQPFKPLERGKRVGAVGIESRHAVMLEIGGKMRRVAAEQDSAFMRQAHQQAAVTRRMAGHGQHDDAAVTENILVTGDRLDLARVTTDPLFERIRRHVRRR